MTALLSLSAEELERARRFADDADRGRWVASRAFLRAALGRVTGADPSSLVFEPEPGGKPAVAGGPHFSLAHSGDLALLAVCEQVAVGADLEMVRPELARPPSAERFFSASERAELAELSEPERVRRFFQLWTAKEAYLKATGAGVAGAGALESVPEAGYVLRRPPVPAAYEAAVVALAEAAVFSFEEWG